MITSKKTRLWCCFSLWKSWYGGHAISRQKHVELPVESYLLIDLLYIGMSVARTDRRAYGQVITRISRLDRLPNFLRYGVPLARALHALRAPLWINVKFSIFSRVSKVKWDSSCPVPVRRLFRPSRSMHFGDVSETNGPLSRTTWPETHRPPIIMRPRD